MLGLNGYGRKPRQFSYKPVYWDEEKELRDDIINSARLRAADNKPGDEEEYVPGSIIRAKRLRRMKSTQKMQSRSGSTLVRVMIFLLGLGAVFYFLADYITVLVD